MDKTVAVIDVGTNSFLLTIAKGKVGGFDVRTLHEEARIVGLGMGIGDGGIASPFKEKATSVLLDYIGISRSYGADEIHVVATEVGRRWDIGWLEERAREEGVTFRILSPEEEGRFSYLSAAIDFGGDITVLDAGGGSTEVIYPLQSGLRVVSLPIGAGVLTRQYIHTDPITDDEYRSLVSCVRGHLGNLLFDRAPRRLVLIGGSAVNIATMIKGIPYNREAICGLVVRYVEMQGAIDKLRSMSVAERRGLVGIEKGREETILAGAVILLEVMRHLSLDVAKVSVKGVRWGVVYSILSGDGLEEVTKVRAPF